MLVSNMERSCEDVSIETCAEASYNPPSDNGLDSSADDNQFNLQTVTTMFLRITYWLNTTLTKSINVGLCAITYPNAYEPYIILASANSDRKVFGISQKQWGVLTSRMNEVTMCLINKQKKAVFIDFELALAIKQMFGKQFVTLFGFTQDQMKPFLLTEHEWKVIVNHTGNINGYLSELTAGKEVMNQYINNKLTQPLAVETKDRTRHDRLEEELTVFMRYK